MAEPTSALEYEGLILRVARESGFAYHGSSGNERAMVPADDAHNLDLSKRIVNDGIRMFIADAPENGWRWMRRIASVTVTATRDTGTADAADSTSITDLTLADTYDSNDDLNGYWIYILTGTGAGSYAQITDYVGLTGVITVVDWLDAYGNPGGTDPVATDTFAITPIETVGGDIHRYPLPENFGGEVDGEIKYASNTNHSSTINWVHESYIRSRRSVTVITGYPLYAATRPLEPYAGGVGPKRRFEIIFDPAPVAADTFEFPYTLFFDDMKLEAGTASSVDGSTGLLDSSLDGLFPDDYFNSQVIKIISGDGKNSYALVTDYAGATAKFTVADWLSIDGTAGGTDPTAGSAYVVTPAANLHPAGFRFDQAILAACLAQAEIEVEDVQAGFMQKYTQKALSKAYNIDKRSAPRSLGTMNAKDRHFRERIFRDRTYN